MTPRKPPHVEAEIIAVAPVPLLDADGVAELLNLPRSWILAEARADRIPHMRFGRYVRFDAAGLREWASAQCRGVTRAPQRGRP
jgi:excisionase family DNA binding protein